MRKIPWAAAIVGAGLLAAPALAEDVYLNQNQPGFTLPGVTLPQGQDEVRAADGTTCRSAVSGSGAYLDVGVIRGNGNNNIDMNDLATYGRVVIPIGRQQTRLNCEKLYELEVERLKMELNLLKMGLGEGGKPPHSADAGWADEGWTTGDTKAALRKGQ
jgi:hypothetical protein